MDKNEEPNNDGLKNKNENENENEKPDKVAEPSKSDNKSGDNKTVPYSRFKEVNEKAKELDKLKAELEESENQKLEEQKKYKDLAEKYKLEKQKLEASLKDLTKSQAVITMAQGMGFKDPSDAIKFVNINKLDVNENGEIEGLEEELDNVLKQKPYLAEDNGGNSLGADIDQSDNNNANKTYRLSEIRTKLKDREWYEKNKDWVEKARDDGRIIDDSRM